MWLFLYSMTWGSSTGLHDNEKKSLKVNFSTSQLSANKTTRYENVQPMACNFIHCKGLEMPSFVSLFFHPWSSKGHKVLCCNKIDTSLKHDRQYQNGKFSCSLLQPRGPNPELFIISKGSSKFFATAAWSRLDINKGNNTYKYLSSVA